MRRYAESSLLYLVFLKVYLKEFLETFSFHCQIPEKNANARRNMLPITYYLVPSVHKYNKIRYLRINYLDLCFLIFIPGEILHCLLIHTLEQNAYMSKVAKVWNIWNQLLPLNYRLLRYQTLYSNVSSESGAIFEWLIN